MIKIPEKVKIGDECFKIKNKKWIDFKGNVSGQINYTTSTILIKKGLPEKIKEDTFFHEIAHGILKEMSFNYPFLEKYRNDESFAQELGLILRKIFLDLLKNQEKGEN